MFLCVMYLTQLVEKKRKGGMVRVLTTGVTFWDNVSYDD